MLGKVGVEAVPSSIDRSGVHRARRVILIITGSSQVPDAWLRPQQKEVISGRLFFALIDEIAANASRLSFTADAGGDESSLGPSRGLFNLGTNKASLVLDKTVSELQATLSRLEAEISAAEVRLTV